MRFLSDWCGRKDGTSACLESKAWKWIRRGRDAACKRGVRVGWECRGTAALLHFYQLCPCRHGDGGTLQTPCKDNLSPYLSVSPCTALSSPFGLLWALPSLHITLLSCQCRGGLKLLALKQLPFSWWDALLWWEEHVLNMFQATCSLGLVIHDFNNLGNYWCPLRVVEKEGIKLTGCAMIAPWWSHLTVYTWWNGQMCGIQLHALLMLLKWVTATILLNWHVSTNQIHMQELRQLHVSSNTYLLPLRPIKVFPHAQGLISIIIWLESAVLDLPEVTEPLFRWNTLIKGFLCILLSSLYWYSADLDGTESKL